MKYLLLSFALLFSCGSYAQGVKQADLLGTWHFSKLKSGSDIKIDAANPKVAEEAAIKKLKKEKPGATKDDENKTLMQIKQMQGSIANMYCTFNADGTFEEAKMKSPDNPEGKPKSGTYKLTANGTKLAKTFAGQANTETVDIKIKKSVLVLDLKSEQRQVEYRK